MFNARRKKKKTASEGKSHITEEFIKRNKTYTKMRGKMYVMIH